MPRVAAIQMVSTPELEENLDSAAALLRQAADQGAEFAQLPEFFPIIGREDTDKLAHQEDFGGGPLQDFLAGRAREHGLWLMGGTIPLKSGDPGRVLNSCLLFSPEGECVARYDKIHLFDVSIQGDAEESYRESRTMMPGSEVTVAKTPIGNIGMSVCYDLRFPELYRRMLDQNIDIITVPSAFTETTGRKHWEVLLRSRAIENLSFVIAAAQGGQNTETRATWGHSMIIDPWGDILGELEKGPGVVCADIDLERVRSLRQSFPALRHRTLI
ncbi:MAG: carbon-nitrogen hydrolase family protein [Gammaproteobacteria bacterium]|jgi:predicted amidohydrolase